MEAMIGIGNIMLAHNNVLAIKELFLLGSIGLVEVVEVKDLLIVINFLLDCLSTKIAIFFILSDILREEREKEKGFFN